MGVGSCPRNSKDVNSKVYGSHCHDGHEPWSHRHSDDVHNAHGHSTGGRRGHGHSCHGDIEVLGTTLMGIELIVTAVLIIEVKGY